MDSCGVTPVDIVWCLAVQFVGNVRRKKISAVFFVNWMIDGGASWNYATFGWCIGGSLVHQFLQRVFLHMGVPMKNAATLDCIRSEQPSGCQKLSFWSKLIFPAPKFPHLVDKLFARRLLYFNKRRQPLKSRCPSKSWISQRWWRQAVEPVSFTRGPAERKVWTKSRMPQRREDFDA